MKWSKGLCELAPESQLWADLFSSAEKRALIEYDVFFLLFFHFLKNTLIEERRRTEEEEVLLTLDYFLFTYIIFQDFNSVLFFTKERFPVSYTACKQLGCFSCTPLLLQVKQSRDVPIIPKIFLPSRCGMTPLTPSLTVLYIYHPRLKHWRASCIRDVPFRTPEELWFWLKDLSYCGWQLRGP